MNPACRTIHLFSFYPLLAGLSMVLAPAHMIYRLWRTPHPFTRPAGDA